MGPNKKIEKLFVDANADLIHKIKKEPFYSDETNTFEFYDLNNAKQILECCITNILVCEFYLEYIYKYLKQYLSISNELQILGAVKDDPQILICIEMIKNLIRKLKESKHLLIEYHILSNYNDVYRPIVNSTSSMMFAMSWQNELLIPKTAEDIFQILIEAIYRSELCFESIDYLFNSYVYLDSQNAIVYECDYLLDQSKQLVETLLDDYLEFKMNHFIMINI
jgi:hypothetical protein